MSSVGWTAKEIAATFVRHPRNKLARARMLQAINATKARYGPKWPGPMPRFWRITRKGN